MAGFQAYTSNEFILRRALGNLLAMRVFPGQVSRHFRFYSSCQNPRSLETKDKTCCYTNVPQAALQYQTEYALKFVMATAYTDLLSKRHVVRCTLGHSIENRDLTPERRRLNRQVVLGGNKVSIRNENVLGPNGNQVVEANLGAFLH
jgi:hypothetical protein